MTRPTATTSGMRRPEPPLRLPPLSGPSPLLVLGCDGCKTAYQATGEQATTLRAIPARTVEYLDQAGQYARAAGWEMNTDTGEWRCARCREKYGDTGQPRRFTMHEVGRLRWGWP